MIRLREATEEDAEEIAALRNAAAEHLTARFGKGHWSGQSTAQGVVHRMRQGTVYVVRTRVRMVATLALTGRKPWAIDPSHFRPVERPLYLVDMAVLPARQGRGIGRGALVDAVRIARGRGAGSLRLDAYDAPAGAGGFYERCGFSEVGRGSFRKVPLVFYERIIEG